MINSSISGLELFQMPFSSHSARQPQAAKHQDSGRQQHPTEAQAKAPQPQSGLPAAGLQAKIQKPAAQAVKPAASTAKNPDITSGNDTESRCAKPADKIKAAEQVQFGKVQENVPEKQPAPAPDQKAQLAAETTEPPAPADTTEQPETKTKELVLDMSSGCGAACNDKSDNTDDTEKRRAHEAAEEKRKAEWEAAQQAKKQKRDEALQKIKSMSDADIIAESTRRISTDVERITRRNLKECVSEHIQDLCRKDTAFARLTLHPRKSMINCFKYINRKAKDFIQQEMKDHDTKPENGIYGCDVPDGLVYQWAEDYMHDADAPEDQEKKEKFVPRPYVNTRTKTKKAASKAKKSDKPADKTQKQEHSVNYEQMTLGV